MGLFVKSSLTYAQRLEARRWMERRRQFSVVGRLRVLFFDPEGMDLPDPKLEAETKSPFTEFWERVESWFRRTQNEVSAAELDQMVREAQDDDPVFQRNLLDWQSDGPKIGLSADAQELLLLGETPHPPTIVDGRARPFVEREQRYRDRTTVQFGDYLVIRPVLKIAYKPEGVASIALMDVQADWEGNHMAFFVNPGTKEAHLVGGRFLPPRIPTPHVGWEAGDGRGVPVNAEGLRRLREQYAR